MLTEFTDMDGKTFWATPVMIEADGGTLTITICTGEKKIAVAKSAEFGARNYSYDASKRKWRVRVGGRYIGLFSSEFEAQVAANKAKEG